MHMYVMGFLNEITCIKQPYIWGRIVKGDSIEIVSESPAQILRVALLLKLHIKAFVPEDKVSADFKRYGVRISVGIGELRINDKERGIIDGEAIYLSGRGLNQLSDLKRCTMAFASSNQELANNVDIVLTLVDTLINKATQKQCKILYYKIMKYNEKEIAEMINASQSNVNQAAASASWQTISKVIEYFETLKF